MHAYAEHNTCMHVGTHSHACYSFRKLFLLRVGSLRGVASYFCSAWVSYAELHAPWDL